MPQHRLEPDARSHQTAPRSDTAKPADAESSQTEATLTHIVGIGASAGGLQALESFFEHLIPPPGMAFVIVQHLSPDFKSLMHELLARHTQMRIVCVDGDTPVEPQTIYLNPARQDLSLVDGVLKVSEFPALPSVHVHHPIDHFLTSLAQAAGDKAIAIILSGTGNDGENGIRKIKEYGGSVFVQDVASATFDGMPRSAIATGVADTVMEPKHMPRAILGSISALRLNRSVDLEIDEAKMSTIVSLLGQDNTIDFAPYRRTTLYRRIHRRMMLTTIPSIDAYIENLRTSADERHLLAQDLLINVTRFFRDHEAYAILERQIIPNLLQRASDNKAIRIWVTACSTGEEAYSIAMILREQMDQRLMTLPVKIFATDVDQEALAIASSGCYPERIAEEMSPERLQHFFVRHGTEYQVTRRLREMITFAPHDLTQDPPFVQMELISCRNCLIYLESHTQQQILALLGYALRNQGYMWLGPSESIDPLDDYFEPLHRKWRLYQKTHPVPLPQAAPFGAPSRPALTFGSPMTKPQNLLPGSTRSPLAAPKPWSVYDEMVQTYCPPALVIDKQGDVLWVVGDGAAYLKRPSGLFSTELLQIIIDDLSIPVSTALQRIRQGKTEVAYERIQLHGEAGEQWINLRLRHIEDDQHPGGLILVLFEENNLIQPRETGSEVYDVNKFSSQHIRDLQNELQAAQISLRATIQELETSNEEYQATNEELKASNQELHSSNEELHSVNQELYTVNAEYQSKIHELTSLNNDIDNLLRSTDIGTIFLDCNMCIRKFTPAVTAYVPLLPQDIGRPLHHLSMAFSDACLQQHIDRVVHDGERVERELQTTSGERLLLQIQPFLMDNGTRDGAILSFIDISDLDRAQLAVKDSQILLQATLDTLPIHIAAIDRHGEIISVNAAWQRFAIANGIDQQNVGVGANYLQVCDTPSGEHWEEAPRVAQAIRELLSGERETFCMEYPCHSPVEERWFMMQAISFAGEGPTRAVVTHEDITERKRMQAKANQHAEEIAEANLLLAERNTELVEFTRAIHHDLQEPLRQVVTFSQLLQQSLGDNLTNEVEESLGFVVGGTQRMLALVQSLTDFSLMGQVDIKREPTDLNLCIHDALKALGLRLESTGAKITYETLPEVTGDRFMLTQLYQNIIGNAIKFIGQASPVVHLTAERQADRWVLGVLDNGIGIDPAHAKSIFDPFKRLHGRSQYEGSGLGLAICRRIIRRHSGDIWVDSQPGQGAHFKFTLPDHRTKAS